MRRRLVPVLPAATVLLLALLPAPAARGGDDVDAALARYQAYLKRPSLYMRHRGRVRLAETHDARALQVLARGYRSPEEPKAQVRYLLASICADAFPAPEHAPAFATWRAAQRDAEDAWLWYRTLPLELAANGPTELIAVARGSLDVHLRAAALRVLAEGKDTNALPVLARLLDELPARPLDRAVLLETAAEVLWITRAERARAPWKEAAGRLVPFLDQVGVHERTKRVIARRLASIWSTPDLALEAAPWLARLEGKTPPPPTVAGERYAGPKPPFFLGLEGTGRRVAYVLDLSDSMLTPLTGEEVEELKKTPLRPAGPAPVVTGGGAPQGGPGADAPDGPPETAAGLPWDRIRTRFDAARAFLALSLRGLGPETSFCVVTFGSEAGLLPATPGLEAATPRHVEAAVRALQAIVPGPPVAGRPLGTLGGYTNLHGGLRRAFQVRGRSLAKGAAYVDEKALWEGCDTIFVLSDGKPTWDDWPAKDTLDPDNRPGDPEFGAETKDSKTATFYGPYAIASWLLDDLRRLELTRHVEIHCVGLGEYDPRLLAAIAYEGRGRFRRIGGGER